MSEADVQRNVKVMNALVGKVDDESSSDDE